MGLFCPSCRSRRWTRPLPLSSLAIDRWPFMRLPVLWDSCAILGPEYAGKLGERRFHAGAVVINDVLMHAFGTHARRILVPELPFGGVGASGIGCYHGRHTFSAFSHLQSAMHRTEAGEWINEHTRYPPMTDGKMAWMERLLWAMPSKRHLSH